MSITIGIGKNLKVTPTPTPPPFSYDADLLTYVSGLATPLSDAQMLRLNTLFLCIKAALSITNLSDALDCFYIFANETYECALRNAVKRSHDATLVNAPTFTQYEGFLGNGSDQYIKTNYNPGADAVNYALNSASGAIYLRTNVRAAAYFHLSIYQAATNSQFHIVTNTTVFQLRVNSTAFTQYAHGNNISGFTIHSRNSNTDIHYARNGGNYTSDVDASIAVPNQAQGVFALAMNNNGAAQNYSPNQMSMAFMSRFLTNDEQKAFITCFESYMDDLGKGVIT